MYCSVQTLSFDHIYGV